MKKRHQRKATYHSDEFETLIEITRRMPNTCDVTVMPKGSYVRFYRWSRFDLACYLKALRFRVHRGWSE